MRCSDLRAGRFRDWSPQAGLRSIAQGMVGLACLIGLLLASAAAMAQEQPPPSLQERTGAPNGAPRDLGWSLDFGLNQSNNIFWILIAVSLILCALGAILFYRGRLREQVRVGIHPDHFLFTTYVVWFGIFLFLTFLILWEADPGIHLLLLVLFVVAFLAALVVGRLLVKLALLVLVLMIVTAAVRYWTLIA